MAMFYFYLLHNKQSGNLYYGSTKDLRRRLKQHCRHGSWELVYYEAYKSEKDARDREKQIKQYGQALSHLKKRLRFSLAKPTESAG